MTARYENRTPGTITRPVRFTGTPEEAAANRQTHRFGFEDRCFNCDCRPGGAVVEYPCGAEVPYETIESRVA